MLCCAAVFPFAAHVPAEETIQPLGFVAFNLLRSSTSATGDRQILAVQTTNMWGVVIGNLGEKNLPENNVSGQIKCNHLIHVWLQQTVIIIPPPVQHVHGLLVCIEEYKEIVA